MELHTRSYLIHTNSIPFLFGSLALQTSPHVSRCSTATAATVLGTDAAVDDTVAGPTASAAPAAIPSGCTAAVTGWRWTAAICAATAAGTAISDDVPCAHRTAATGAAVLPECRRSAATSSAAHGADVTAASGAVVRGA